MKKLALPLLFFSCAVLSNAQDPFAVATTNYRGSGDAKGNQWGTLTVSLQSPVPPALAGAPFSGKQERKSEQLLADGTRITQPTQVGAQAARDAQGRTRIERPVSPVFSNIPGRSTQPLLMIVEINDVVDGYYYVLDPAKKIAYRVKYTPAQPRSIPATLPQANRPQVVMIPGGAPEMAPQVSGESLGSKYIQGVQAEGKRTTSVTPVGSRGNDRAMTEVRETWTAPSLQLPILTSSKSPTGNTTIEVVNLSTLNPAPDLFRPPPGYQVRDQPQTFTVEFGNQPAATPLAPGTQR